MVILLCFLGFWWSYDQSLLHFPWSGGPTVNLSRYPLLSAGCRWPRGGSSLCLVRCCVRLVFPRQMISLAFSVVWWSYGKSLAVSVIVRWLPVAPRRFKPAPRALLRLSGGPTATLSRLPWSGGPTLNLSRFSVPRLVLRSISRISVVWWSYGKALAFSAPRLVPR